MRVGRIAGKFEHYGVLVVPVKVNGMLIDWMVDSGASFCAISKRVTEQMDLKIDTTQSISVAPASGKISTCAGHQDSICKGWHNSNRKSFGDYLGFSQRAAVSGFARDELSQTFPLHHRTRHRDFDTQKDPSKIMRRLCKL